MPDEDRGFATNTLAGAWSRLPGLSAQTTDVVEWEGWRFEAVDMGWQAHRLKIPRALPALSSVVACGDLPVARGFRAVNTDLLHRALRPFADQDFAINHGPAIRVLNTGRSAA